VPNTGEEVISKLRPVLLHPRGNGLGAGVAVLKLVEVIVTESSQRRLFASTGYNF
jgi:hypothetical protein